MSQLSRSEQKALEKLLSAIFLDETAKALSLIVPGLPLDASGRESGQTPLIAAIQNKNVAVFEALLAAGARHDAPNEIGDTPLHAAAVEGNEALVRVLVARGADVNARIARKGHQYDGRTPLMNAACSNSLSVIKLLLEHGADPFTKDKGGQTALDFAEIFGKRAANHLRKVMAGSGASSTLSLHDAAAAGLADRVQALLDAGTPVDARDARGRTALHHAAGRGHAHLVRLLIDRGADVNVLDSRGFTALTLADASPDVVQLLLAAGVDPNATLGEGQTVFHAMAMFGSPEVLTLLIDAGADLHARTADGRTALDLAKTNSHKARKLLQDRMGIPARPIHEVFAEVKRLVELAKAAEFQATANRLGTLFHRKPSPWRRRKGVVYFHDVSIVKHLAPIYGDPPAASGDASDRMFHLLARLQDEIRTEGFTLVYIDSIPKDGRLPLILLPTANKYTAVLASGTNGINSGHDTEAVIGWLMDMEKENPFVLAGCGHDFLDGRFSGPVANAHALAERMLAFCPDMVDQAEASMRLMSRPKQVAAIARALSESGWFGFWWD